jgi:competence protein ComEA
MKRTMLAFLLTVFLLPGLIFALPDKANTKMRTQSHAVVNINLADKAELSTLKGIGQKKAEAIIDYRKANGPFTSLQDLEKVRGFSKKTVDKLAEMNKDRITFERK